TYYDLAEKAARQSLDLLSDAPTAVPAMTLLAVVDLAKHRLREPGEQAQKALALDPREMSAHGVIGAAFEMGDYDRAEKFYATLLETRWHPPSPHQLAGAGRPPGLAHAHRGSPDSGRG